MSKNKTHAMKWKPEKYSKNALTQCGKMIQLRDVSPNINEVSCIKCLKAMRKIVNGEYKIIVEMKHLIDIQLIHNIKLEV